MTIKSLVFTCYRILSNENLFSSANVVRDLCDALDFKSTVESRLINVTSKKESTSRDVLSWYEKSEDNTVISFVIMRMNLSDNIKEIEKRLMNEKLFMMEELSTHELGSGNGVYASHYYVAMNERYLISNCKNIKSLERYLNGYLNSDYKIVPLIDGNKVLRLRDVDSIEFFASDKDFVGNKRNVNNNFASRILSTFLSNLSEMMTEVPVFEKEKMAKCISASLKVVISSSDDYSSLQNTFGAILKPIEDLDNVIVITKDGRKMMKGAELLVMRKIEIEKDNNNLISERRLRYEMERVLSDVTRKEDERCPKNQWCQ